MPLENFVSRINFCSLRGVVSYSYHKRQGMLPPECDCRYKEAWNLFLLLSLVARCHPARTWTYPDRKSVWKFCCYLSYLIVVFLNLMWCTSCVGASVPSSMVPDSICLSLCVHMRPPYLFRVCLVRGVTPCIMSSSYEFWWNQCWHCLAQSPIMEIESIPDNDAWNACWYFLNVKN
jgi:hypothetical protein